MTDDVHFSSYGEVQDPAGAWRTMSVSAVYSPVTDPYAVTITFYAGDPPREWMMGRDLLRDGLEGMSGEGDVLLWPEGGAMLGGWLMVELRPLAAAALREPRAMERALIRLPYLEVRSFYQRTLQAVPEGTEGGHIDIDGALELLLEEEI